MENKKFLGLPIIHSASWQATLRHLLNVLLFTALGYFIIAISAGLIMKNDQWYFIQQVEKDYLMQLYILLLGTLLGHLMRALGNFGGRKFFFMLPWLDKWLFPIGLAIAYMVINEIAGF